MPSVGEILAAERRRQGKSLNDAVDGTKIRSRLLDALEGGRYDELPSPAYVKGYIQSYARFLEIPSEPLLEQYRLEASAHVGKRSAADRYLDIPHETLVPDRAGAHAIPQSVWIATAAVVLIVALLVCGLTRLLSGDSSGTMPTKPKNEVAGEVSASPGADETSTATEPSTTVTSTAPGTSFKLRVTVREGQASWLQAKVDGLVAYEGTLQGGDSREWLVTDTATLRAGKPSVLTVTRDGKKTAIPTSAGISQLTLSVGG
jgi:cytoskeletal protein RodZ